jgi:nicotinamide riboside kinase
VSERRCHVDAPLHPLCIAVVGAECTGKSALCEALARALPGLWLPEVLREFCDAHRRTPRADEQAALLEAQLAREAQGLRRARAEGLRWVIADSTPLATALYSVELFGDASLFERALQHQRSYALTLLAGDELPWVADGVQRDGPAARAAFQRRLASTLQAHRLAFTTVSGMLDERLARALAAARAASRSRARPRRGAGTHRI